MASKGQARGSTLLALAIGLLPQAPMAQAVMAQTAPPQGSAAESSAAKLGIRVAPVILAEPEVETSIIIQVGPDSSIPRQTFLRLRGLPLMAKLSEGHIVSPGVWAVPLSALPSLRLLAPLSSSGRTEIHMSLVGVDGGMLAETKSSLVVAPDWLLGSSGQRQDVTRAVPQSRPEIAAATPPPVAPPPIAAPVVEARTIPAVVEQPRAPAAPPAPPAVMPAPKPAPVAAVPQLPAAPTPVPPTPQPATRPEAQAPVVAALPPAAAPIAPPAPLPPPAAARAVPSPAPAAVAPVAKPPPQLSAADRERAESMVQRGDAFWRQGNFAAARQFFRRAADMGLAAGALRMGATFDPVELSSVTVVGLNPDLKEASTWYERARELGAPEAGARLSRLQSR